MAEVKALLSIPLRVVPCTTHFGFPQLSSEGDLAGGFVVGGVTLAARASAGGGKHGIASDGQVRCAADCNRKFSHPVEGEF